MQTSEDRKEEENVSSKLKLKKAHCNDSKKVFARVRFISNRNVQRCITTSINYNIVIN